MKNKILKLFKKPAKKSVIYYNQITRLDSGKSQNSELINFMFKQSIKKASRKADGRLNLI